MTGFVDFLRFCPKSDAHFKELFEGYSLAVCFISEDSTQEPILQHLNEELKFECKSCRGHLVRAESVADLQKKLRKVRGFVGVMSSDAKVNREAIMRRKVDVLLDFEERSLDYASLKLAAEKDVVIEVSLSKFLRTRGFKRMVLLDETRLLLKLLLKFGTPFLLTSGAENVLELRPRKQLYSFFSFLARDAGIDYSKLLKLAEENSTKIFRRLADSNYLMDGLEIEGLTED